MSEDGTGKVIPLKGGKCPICGRPAMPKFRPFCSSRCADIDLGRWLKGNYHVPGSALYEGADADDEGKETDTEAKTEGPPGKKD